MNMNKQLPHTNWNEKCIWVSNIQIETWGNVDQLLRK
jgi:hypothetical protein